MYTWICSMSVLIFLHFCLATANVVAEQQQHIHQQQYACNTATAAANEKMYDTFFMHEHLVHIYVCNTHLP